MGSKIRGLLALLVVACAVSACGSFGGSKCEPDIDYPKSHPCYQDER
jgi:hypothetical protein